MVYQQDSVAATNASEIPERTTQRKLLFCTRESTAMLHFSFSPYREERNDSTGLTVDILVLLLEASDTETSPGGRFLCGDREERVRWREGG